MSIFYKKIERHNPQNPTAPKKWYAVLKTIGQVKEKEVAKMIAEETTINRKEVEMALDLFPKVLIRELLNSKSVQLGDWGSFHLTCNSKGADTREGITAASIKGLNIRFVPGQELNDALNNASFAAFESTGE